MSRRTAAATPLSIQRIATVSVRLSAESHARLRVAAARRGVSMGVVLADLWERSVEAKTEAQRVDSGGR